MLRWCGEWRQTESSWPLNYMIWVTWIHLDVNFFFSIGKSIIIVHCVINWSSKYRTLVREDPGIQWTDKLYVDFQLHDALALITIVLLKGQVYKILIINHRIISHHLSAEATICLGFPDGASGKDFCLPVPEMQENVVIPGLRRSPGVENSTLLQIFLPGEFHGQRSLVGCSPWGCKESHMTECVHTHTHTICSGRKRH